MAAIWRKFATFPALYHFDSVTISFTGSLILFVTTFRTRLLSNILLTTVIIEKQRVSQSMHGRLNLMTSSIVIHQICRVLSPTTA